MAAAGRMVGTLARATRRGSGTTLPGRLVLAVDHGFLARRAAGLPDGSVVISGTNGKTTTASMLQAILRAEGVPFVANDSGSNLRGGVVSAFVSAPHDARVAVMEVDEAALPSVVADIRPRLLVLTNVFRDQLDRFGEPDRVAELLRQAADGLPPGASIVANGDDPSLWATLEDLDPIGFSVLVETQAFPAQDTFDAEPEICIRCGGRLRFIRRTIANLGSARCAGCGWVSPDPECTANVVAQAGVRASVFEICGEIVTLPLGGLHNTYNAAAAIASACELGIEPVRAIAALESLRPRFGRGEELSFADRRLWLALIKNPAGAGPVIQAVCADQRVGAVVVAVSDRHADGRDVSWIWDADFERLASLEVPIVTAGTRAADAAVRMKYAGASPEAVDTDPLGAVRVAAERCPPDGMVVVLATYTAMLDVRQGLMGARSARVTDGAR